MPDRNGWLTRIPQGVLMVGSAPFSSTSQVFRTLCERLPDRLEAIPDGEVGERNTYIVWQLSRIPPAVIGPLFGGDIHTPKPTLTLEDFKPTDYDTAAIASYQEFVKLRDEGLVPSNVRFQVGLPTPLNVVLCLSRPDCYEEFEALYLRRFEESLEAIFRAIPSHDLVIQLDIPDEVLVLEYEQGNWPDCPFPPYWSPVKQGMVDRIVHICSKIPTEVPVAFHLCYGDLHHRHFVEPQDTGIMVGLVNDLYERVSKTHRIPWFHLPVPRSRSDRAYFEPLNKLDIHGTKLYLGLVHANDESGTRERIASAQKAFPLDFGVATECGLGRTPVEEIDSILAISKAVTDPCIQIKNHQSRKGGLFGSFWRWLSWRLWSFLARFRFLTVTKADSHST